MAGGRPTQYSQDKLKKAQAYLASFDTSEPPHGEVIPMIAGLALALGVHRDTIYAWADDPDKQEFSDTLKALKDKQELMLANGGLNGAFQPNITKMLMASNHGYSDKVETDHKSSDGSMTPKPLDLSGLSDDALKEIVEAADAQAAKSG